MFADGFLNFCDFEIVFGFMCIAEGALVVFGDLRDGAVGKNRFAVVSVVVFNEDGVQRVFYEFEVPPVAAIHAVGVGGDTCQIGADTLFAAGI